MIHRPLTLRCDDVRFPQRTKHHYGFESHLIHNPAAFGGSAKPKNIVKIAILRSTIACSRMQPEFKLRFINKWIHKLRIEQAD